MQPYVTSETIETKSREWLKRIAPFNQHKMELNPEKSALMVIIPKLQRLISAFRECGRPVIYTRHVHHPGRLDIGIMEWWWEGICLEGSPESEIHRSIAPLPEEKVILKHRYSAFYNTDLETVLRCLKIEDLVICGIMSNLCCESTARDAYFRDYRVFFPADGTGSINEEMHLATLLNLAFGFAYVTECEEIMQDLKKLQSEIVAR